jgi:hypothetical protein
MKYFFLLAASTLLVLQSFGQNTGTIRGSLIDTTTKQILKGASITVLEEKDSTLVKFGLADEKGNFVINDIPFGNYLMLIAFQGYKPQYKNISLTRTSPLVAFPPIIMEIQANELNDVVVTASPIVVKKDTVDFNANMFKTKPNATAEDLLKKLPGVEVDRDGNVRAQGQQVTRVLVDGKRFFGDDPKLATRNLPTDMIDRVQVIDGLSDQAAFSGFDDGNREKTINIITKKDRRKGWFGKASAGAGTNNRYENSLSVNRFNGNQQISFIGQGNNTNKQSFTVQDILGSVGGGNAGGGGRGGAAIANLGGGAFRQASSVLQNFSTGANGIVESWAGGLNYRDNWGKKTEVSGSYFFNNTQVIRDQTSLTENVLGSAGASLFNEQVSKVNNTNQNHRINFNIETRFDSLTSMIFRPNVSFQRSFNINESVSNQTRGKVINVNQAKFRSESENQGVNASAELLLRRRFLKRGRSISANFNFGGNTNDGEGNSYTTQINLAAIPNRFDTLDQRFNSESNSRNFSTNISYTEPIAKNSLMEFSYNFNNNLSNSVRETFRFNRLTGQYDIADTLQTNNFENTFKAHRGNVNYRYQKDKYSFSFGGGIQWADLVSINTSRKTTIDQSFINFFPNANFSFNKSRTESFRFNYRGNTNQPNATQLQPVFDITNPLNVRGGNPNLKQEFRHFFNLFYNKFNFMNFKTVFASLNFSLTQNRIANSTFIYLPGDPLPPGIPAGVIQPGAIISQPVNINGVYSVSGFFTFGRPLKKPKSNINFTTNASYNQDASFINSEKNFTRNYVIGQTVTWTMNVKEKLDINLTSTSTFNGVRNTFSSAQNQNFFSQLISADFTYSNKKRLLMGSDFDLNIFAGRTDGFNQAIPLWTPFIAYQVFKNKSGEIRLSVFDILNKNTFIDRTINANSIRDVQTQVLQRYMMLSFTYNLRKFGGPQQPNQMMNMMQRFMPRGGMRM